VQRIHFDLREDEQSAWLPVDMLPDAVVGDRVAVSSDLLAAARVGTVVETVDDDQRGRFHRVTFEPDG
jgi:hypothetical protein